VLAERLGCLAELLNSAIDPARDLAAVGEQTFSRSGRFLPCRIADELRARTGGDHPA
jgi:hypothetical protein